MPVLAKAVLVGSGLAAARAPGLSGNEEAPPSTLGLWIGLGLLAAVLLLVWAGMAYHRRRQLRAASVLPDDPFAVEAMEACTSLFCELEPARRAAGARIDGPVSFAYVRAADPGEGIDRRAVVRVQGRLRGPGRQLAVSPGQRNGLLGVAAAILIAAFVGLALAPATRIKTSPPATLLVRDGVPLGGTRLLTYRKGGVIELTVCSDIAGEVHFHGYDVHRYVAPGRPARLLIRATIEGSYPVELEGHAQPLAQVTVQP